MNEIRAFPGFPKEGLRFLADLRDNNNRRWFEAHKDIYRAQLLEPAQAFVVTLGERLQEISPRIVFDPRTSGSGSIFRIYRDTRFSKDKSPYKTHLGIFFWEGAGRKMENPGFYFHLEPGEVRAHAGQHTFPNPMLAAYRDAVVDDKLGANLETVIAKVRNAGAYEIGGDQYKRVPSGYDRGHERADLLRYKGIHASSPLVGVQELGSPDLVDICFEHCANMSPLHHWLVKVAKRAR